MTTRSVTQGDLQLPGALKGVPAHLLTEASNPPTDPPTIARVGAYFHATNESVWYAVNGTPDEAQAIIDRDVVALLVERFWAPEPKPAVDVSAAPEAPTLEAVDKPAPKPARQPRKPRKPRKHKSE